MRNRLILAFLSFSTLWSVKAMAGGTLLRAYLPKKTFIIPSSRFSTSSGSYLPSRPPSYRHGGTRVIFNNRAPARHQAGILTHAQAYAPQYTATNQQGQAAQQQFPTLPQQIPQQQIPTLPQQIPQQQIPTLPQQPPQQQIPTLPQQPPEQQTQGLPQQQPTPMLSRTRIQNYLPQQAIPQRGSVQRIPAINFPRPEIPRLPVGPLENMVIRTPSREPKCLKIPPPGECRGAFPRYYYNNLTDQCDCFLYGGCGSEGLDYSFRTLEECHASCAPALKEEGPVCQKVFDDEEYFFDEPNESPVPPDESSRTPQIDETSRDVLLTILLRTSPADTLPGQRLGP